MEKVRLNLTHVQSLIDWRKQGCKDCMVSLLPDHLQLLVDAVNAALAGDQEVIDRISKQFDK